MIPSPRPTRCLRHHVWLASCADCRRAHQPVPPVLAQDATNGETPMSSEKKTGGLLDREMRTCPNCGSEWEALTFWDADAECGSCSTARYHQRLTEINADRAFTVMSIGGACPTQADGRTVDDRPFYFRARHGEWALKLGPVGAPTCYVDWPDDGADLIAEGDDPSHGFMEWDDVLGYLDAHLGATR